MRILSLFLLLGITVSCSQSTGQSQEDILTPVYITDPVFYDSDDPAIWINEDDPAKSLILGTDKEDINGGLYAFTLTGKMDTARKAYPLDRPNNVDVAYNFPYGNDTIDVAVASERGTGKIRVFELPSLKAIDNGGLSVFENDSANNQVMGIALYKRPSDGELFAIVSRKEAGGQDNYLFQYRIYTDSTELKSEFIRQFGKFSGTKEIEAVAVDNELGYVYYSDEHYAIRKYHADPEKGNEELAAFGLDGFADDREGISIAKTGDGTGYILVSDQGANAFRVFPREGTASNLHDHPLITVIPMTVVSSDGSEVTTQSLGTEFPSGLFVAMSDNKTFEIYDWAKLQLAIDEKQQ